MSQVSILIVEDEILHSSKIEMLIEKLGYTHLATADNSQDALQVISTRTPDFILMDVNISGDYDGIELASMINSKRNFPIPVIFITSLQDDMTFKRIKRENPIAFVQKPFTEIQIQRSLELAITSLKEEHYDSGKLEDNQGVLFSESIFIKNRSVFEKISVSKIVYVEAEGRYCTIYLEDKRFVIRSSLSQLLDRLNPQQFFQSHKSYVINLEKVDSINSSEFEIISGQHSIPLSRRLKDELLKKLDVI